MSATKKSAVKKATKKATKTSSKVTASKKRTARKPSINKKGNSELSHIIVKGAKEHNLKNIDVEIPKKSLVVFTGVSGSGKSSLAFDTIFAEGQRRYVESLSSYARQFLSQMEKPKFETIRGLSPTIAIEQKAASKNPRSTVGTITEIYDYLRVLYARIGKQTCHFCSKEVGRGDAGSMVDQIMEMPPGTKVMLLAPIVENRKGEHKDKFSELNQEGFQRVRIDSVIHSLDDIQGLAKNKKHNIEVVVDRLKISKTSAFRKRITDSVETSLKMGGGKLIVHIPGREDIAMSEARSCCGFAFPELDPPLFSFNSPLGMCPECNGLGTVVAMDEDKVIPDPNLSIRDGAIVPWKNYFINEEEREGSWGLEKLLALEDQWNINFNKPWNKLPQKHREWVLWGREGKKLDVEAQQDDGSWAWSVRWEGILNTLMRRYRKTQSESMKSWYGKYMSSALCKGCDGNRLKPEVLSVKVDGKSIIETTAQPIKDCYAAMKSLKLSGNQKIISEELLKEIQSRLGFLVNVGLDYLSLDRKGPTLSGGEAQRIRLASQIGSELTGVLYILDEPSIGLHQRDNLKLLNTLTHLRDIGNTLIVVEHDEETIASADWVLDIGPGAGHLGGQIIAQGTPSQLKRDPRSLTGKYLSGKKQIPLPERRRVPSKKWITVTGASANNLQNIDAKIPVGLFTSITGVSGAGKSTLINQILYPALAKKLHQSSHTVSAHKSIAGLEAIDKVINIDQKAIGRTPRSNPATYTKVFDLIRDFFALLPESKERGYKKGRYSFNVKGGRCENCQGDGYITVEMHFLADVLVPCEVCKGKRFNQATLEIRYKGHSIADILELSVAEATKLFSLHPKIINILNTLMEVGLSYIKLGQAATTLSGGEAQRIKLAKELCKRDTGKTLYILDEPTTGLHFDDIKNLLSVLQRLVDAGNTVIVIEHNLDVIKTADWLIDMGPEGGHRGGQIVGVGSPEKLARLKKSHTGEFLKEILN